MTPFYRQAREYSDYHQKRLTLYIHIASTLFFLLSTFILLGFVKVLVPGIFSINLAQILALTLLVYYILLNWRLALVLLPVLIVILWVSNLFSYAGPDSFSLWSLFVLFLLGAILEIVGYIIEGVRPHYKSHLNFILISPLCITAECFFIMGKMTDLKKEMNTVGITDRS